MATHVLDIGNSFYKFATVEDQTALVVTAYPDVVFLSRIAKGDLLVVGAVKHAEKIAEIQRYCDLHQVRMEQIVTEAEAFGVKHGYPNYATHGVDRWLAVVAARQLCTGAFAVIDLGTANTLDVVDNKGKHLGGWIAPGFDLAKHAILANTDKVFTDAQVQLQQFATDTPGSLEAGCQFQLKGFIEQAVVEVKQHWSADSEIFLTGGSCKLLSESDLKRFNYQPDLVLQGLVLYAQKIA